MKWIVFASGGPCDNPWDEQKEVEAGDFQCAIGNSGFDVHTIDGVIRKDILEDLEP